jgi:lysozyme
MREINEKGLAIIKDSEKLMLDRYKDPVGIYTIGWGHKILWNEPYDTHTITKEQADEILIDDLRKTCDQLAIACEHIPLNDNQWSALVSFCFNTGVQRMMRNSNGSETKIYGFLKMGEYDLAANQFTKWVYAKGIELNGLKIRRAKERSLFLET